MEDLLKQVTELFSQHDDIAHDIKHVLRTAKTARFIAEQEGYDIEEAEIACLLHDVGRTAQKSRNGHGMAGVPLARNLLDRYTKYDDITKNRILEAVQCHSDLGATSKLTQIIQDADMLDGVGAIGIMRSYTAHPGSLDYDQNDIVPTVGKRGATMHEQMAFQMEWPGLMHTNAAKKIAVKRHDFMLKFLEEFNIEAKGLDLRV